MDDINAVKLLRESRNNNFIVMIIDGRVKLIPTEKWTENQLELIKSILINSNAQITLDGRLGWDGQ